MRYWPTRTGRKAGDRHSIVVNILVIQATNNLSDEHAEFLINDRLSFMRFLGLELADRVPDARRSRLFQPAPSRSV